MSASPSPSLAGRATLAVTLMVGFYALALGVAGGLLYIPYAELVYGGRLHIRLALFCVIAAGLILFSMVPRRDRFIAPGPLLKPAKQPRLFERLRKLSGTIGQEMPSEVYLVSDLNAWVSERGGVMGVGSRRVMGLGLPLMQVLTTSEFEAVLAHEFGHYHGGDTRLGPWIYKTRAAIGRTLQNLATDPNEGFNLMSLVQAPFRWYGNLYLRVTLAISRAQEFAADRLAASTIGSAALVGGLRKIHRAAGASQYYLQSDVWPAIQQGFRPPLVTGFESFLGAEGTARLMDESLKAELESPDHGVYDTHPPLRDRIGALEELPLGQPLDETPALKLFDQIEHLEAELAASWLPEGAPQLKPITWAETGDAVLLPRWQALTRKSAGPLKGLTLSGLYPTAGSELDAFARKLNVWQSGVPWEAVKQYASSLLGAALACALHSRGWIVESQPGELMLTNGSRRLNPFSLVNRIKSGEIAQEEFSRIIAELGLDPAISLAIVDAS